ncbi:MAG: polysaccharide pyruvyl transferase family protein [Lachnospiraceae bacterium]|nr:polysaccharide pyruvyl transferase family protein [Lachnospiraceae bacterium]
MKIKIITLHSIYNPGSVFQAFSLQEFLRGNHYNASIIDYRPIYSRIGKNKIKGILRKILCFRNEKRLKEKYESFIQEKMILTNRCYQTYGDLEKRAPKADVYLAGSDQLWNMDYDCGRDNAYYLGFVRQGAKISYATSIGKKEVPKTEMDAVASKIRDFHMVSVREKSSSEILSRRLHREVSWVCDPVFLLPARVYEDMSRRIRKEKYIVIYLSAGSELLYEIVKDIKARTGYRVILMGGNVTRCECEEHIKDLGPYDFLSLIRHAEIVISSSFHATAFSHIFHRKFGVILPEKNGERIESLLNLSALGSHIICKKEDIPIVYEEIDYELVDEKLGVFIENSKRKLIHTLEELQKSQGAV